MIFFKKLKQKNYCEKASDLIKQGDFEKALEYVKKILSKEKQIEAITVGLMMYAVNKKGYTEIDFTKDKKEYEQFQALVGTKSTIKYMFYDNPETGKMEGLTELVEAVVPKDNIVMKYLENL